MSADGSMITRIEIEISDRVDGEFPLGAGGGGGGEEEGPPNAPPGGGGGGGRGE